MTLSRRSLLAAVAAVLAAPASAQPDDAAARRRMVDNIRQLLAAGAGGDLRRLDPEVLRVMGEVPRHLFVAANQREAAYRDGALAIGYEATISQPLVVAMMTDLLDVAPTDVVLEVGTGSGYQAAVLSRLARQVYSIEIVEPLALRAAERLARLGYPNVTVRAGDGYAGWPEHAPFDAIMVTAGARTIPRPLIEQLKPGGRLLIPLGRNADEQRLVLVRKDARGRVTRRPLVPVNFVPLQDPQGRAR
jgi:protein-L-isoaspartate(D-aspartate) O-methyltransferase